MEGLDLTVGGNPAQSNDEAWQRLSFDRLAFVLARRWNSRNERERAPMCASPRVSATMRADPEWDLRR